VSDAPVLSLDGIAKRFGRVVALDHASLALRRGTVHALLGENGAGKTTLMRAAYGLLRPDAGTIRVDGTARTLASPSDAIALGIGMVSQHFTLVPAMTVLENVALGGHGRLRLDAISDAVRAVERDAGLAIDLGARVDALSVAAQQRVEIIKALVRRARVLILDEPTAILAPAEAGELLAWLRRFADDGSSVVLITHKLREALSVADDITVLRRGRTVLTAPATSVTNDDLVGAMLGAGASPVEASAAPTSSATSTRVAASARTSVVRATDVAIHDARGIPRIRSATFDVYRGEIVGVAAVEASGHRELLRALAGRLRPTSGVLSLPESIGFIPEDRHHDALITSMTLAENAALQGAERRRGWMRWRAVADGTRALLDHYEVVAAGPDVAAHTLSGGNQQRFVLGRELDDAPALVVAENPTRGLDVRAAAAVYARLRAARDAGAAVILYSSDIDEVLPLADRMLVVYAGVVRVAPVDRELIGRWMLGAE
jgi:general nucleoside transport system ATP-binding protein